MKVINIFILIPLPSIITLSYFFRKVCRLL
nr:MAG TPA_asm: hypothetical protein [Caudoviricetes sp.]